MPKIESRIKNRLDFAVVTAREAGEFILQHYQSESLEVEVKQDESPVTVADRGAEQLMREHIAAHFPEDGILGEEMEDKPSQNGFRWILDPIDGTKSFVHGVPLFGTLIGLELDERCVLGVCRFAALNEVVYAAQGEGAWWQTGGDTPKPAKVSNVASLDKALFCTTTITGWDTTGTRDVFDRMCQRSGLTRGWSDCYGHALVATGRADVMIDPEMSPWDAAALVAIAQEAGGHFVDWKGDVSIHSNNGISVNAALKDEVLAVIAES
ncbi:MAG: histidinol-phosphatase [Planctomycetaceae bacterium]|nr:histidinol-phosphatase [Planctomycetaceae bacterium]